MGGLDRVLVLEVARVTEAAAIAAARLRGRGDEKAADKAAVDAMRRELAKVHIKGRVVIGEGEMDESPMLYIGEEVGIGDGPEVDIAVDPLEGTTICAKAMPNALAVLAIAERGGLLNAPDMYMNKIAIGPGYPEGIIDLDAPPGDNLNAMAKAKGVPVSEITACILDRPRHAELIAAVRKAGAGVQLIPDGDIAGVIWTTDPKETGIDIYFGIGGAPEGVLAAAALRCIGGQMQGRLHPLKKEEESARGRHGHHRHQAQVQHERDGLGRRDLLGHRRDRRLAAGRRAFPRRFRRDRDGRAALQDRHRAAYQDHLPHARHEGRPLGRRPEAGPTPLRLRQDRKCPCRKSQAVAHLGPCGDDQCPFRRDLVEICHHFDLVVPLLQEVGLGVHLVGGVRVEGLVAGGRHAALLVEEFDRLERPRRKRLPFEPLRIALEVLGHVRAQRRECALRDLSVLAAPTP